MGASAHQEEIAHVLAAIVRAEPGALHQDRFDAECGAAEGEKPIAEVERRGDARGHDLVRQAGKERGFQRAAYLAAQDLSLDVPILTPGEIGRRRQHIERVAARRRHRGVRRARTMEIETEIVSQSLVSEDVVEKPAIARSHQDRVMANFGILPTHAKIPDEQAHRGMLALHSAVGPAPPLGGGQQVHVCEGRIGVGDDDFRFQLFA